MPSLGTPLASRTSTANPCPRAPGEFPWASTLSLAGHCIEVLCRSRKAERRCQEQRSCRTLSRGRRGDHLLSQDLLFEAFDPLAQHDPPLLVGDWLFVNRRLRPHTRSRTSPPSISEPKRGEVAFFTSPPQIPRSHHPAPGDATRSSVVGVAGDRSDAARAVLGLNGSPCRRRHRARAPLHADLPNRCAWQHAHGCRAPFGLGHEPDACTTGAALVPADMFSCWGTTGTIRGHRTTDSSLVTTSATPVFAAIIIRLTTSTAPPFLPTSWGRSGRAFTEAARSAALDESSAEPARSVNPG